MKKQPIDDLFAKKLTNWEPKVSPDLWARIEAQQEKQTRRSSSWFWSIAASVTLLLTTGYLLWQNQPTILTGSGTGTGIAQTEVVLPEAVATEPQINVVASAKEPDEEAPVHETKRIHSGTAGAERLAAVRKSAVAAEKLVENINVPSQKLPEIAAIDRRMVESEALISQNTEPLLSQSVDVVALVNEPKATSEKRVIRANVDWDEPAKEEERKESRFARIMQQLKNAKQGETVDWQEVGFNPKKILARADEKIKNEEDKVSKKYQEFKDKTKL